MPDLPIMLKLTGKRCVVVGGGGVALRRAASLHEAGANVTVIAPQADPKLADLGVRIEQRPYRTGDLEGALLVVIATDDPQVNRQVAQDAAALGVLANRADDPDAGDFSVPAHGRYGPITLAVHTGGISAAAAATIRDELAAGLDPLWPTLLDIAAPYRTTIQQRFDDPAARRDRLLRLTGPDAMATLRQYGPDALRRFCEELTRPDAAANPCTTRSPR